MPLIYISKFFGDDNRLIIISFFNSFCRKLTENCKKKKFFSNGESNALIVIKASSIGFIHLEVTKKSKKFLKRIASKLFNFVFLLSLLNEMNMEISAA